MYCIPSLLDIDVDKGMCYIPSLLDVESKILINICIYTHTHLYFKDHYVHDMIAELILF